MAQARSRIGALPLSHTKAPTVHYPEGQYLGVGCGVLVKTFDRPSLVVQALQEPGPVRLFLDLKPPTSLAYLPVTSRL